MDPFDVFGIPPGFDLDLGSLERRQREIARVVHPDRVAGAGAVERRRALARAVDVNEAFRVLRDPVRRGEALLRKLGVPVGELAEPKPPMHLLLEMMEQREALAEAKAKGDVKAIGLLGGWARGREAEALSALSALFGRALSEASAQAELPGGQGAGRPERGDDEGSPKGVAEQLQGRVGELRYLRRYLDEVKAIEEDFAVRAEEARGA